MAQQIAIDAYAIVSADGMIADENCWMPNSLKFEADQRLFEEALDRVDVVVHGRKSHEGQPNSHMRRRLLMTRAIEALAPDAPAPTCGSGIRPALPWRKPARRSGSRRAWPRSSAGPRPMTCSAPLSRVPSGSRQPRLAARGNPVFSEVGAGRSPEDILRRHGLAEAIIARFTASVT